ncbi:MAG: hypothetical protein LJE68_05795 [Rhodobacter sp.]|jgi:hypothetical protein|nr:hypothetical protein [Rhodobacter sp.]
MFFEDGWVSLSEVTAEVFRRLQAMKAAGQMRDTGDGLRSMLALSVWDICDACSKIGVTGPDGVVVPATKDLIAWADPRELSNEHVNLLVGNVGSSDLPDADGNLPTREQLMLRYGPFVNLPVVLPVNNFQSSLTFLEEEVVKHDPGDEHILRAAQLILTMIEDGELVTREIARVKLGASLSRRKFKVAWALAAQHSPELATPNRWAGL